MNPSVKPPKDGSYTMPGHATAQYGKNDLGDLNEHLPTTHGFGAFLGNRYHLNKELAADLCRCPLFLTRRIRPKSNIFGCGL